MAGGQGLNDREGKQPPQDEERFDRMMTAFAATKTHDEMKLLSWAYIFDLSYPRADICLAMKETEQAKGWR